MEKQLKDLTSISQTIGQSPFYTQGGGGNTSVKIDGEVMAIKASGYQLKDMNEKTGISLVNYQNIIAYFNNPKDDETETTNFVNVQSMPFHGQTLRPSIETGFHAFLHKYVIHTHSVYANILCCSKEGAELSKELFPHSLWIKYQSPGLYLTLEIKKALEKQPKAQILFMENHGLIISTDSQEDVLRIHEEVNQKIKNHFKIDDSYPDITLEQAEEMLFQSKTSFVINGMKDLDIDSIVSHVLFPDQAVYFVPDKIKIENGIPHYPTNQKEAMTIEETLCAYLYIFNEITKQGLTPCFIDNAEADYIQNMDSEKYRKGLLKK